MARNENTRNSNAFSSRSFHEARNNKSIIYASIIYAGIIYVSKKALIYMLSCSKSPKCSKFGVRDMQEKPVDFFYSSRNNVSNLGSFAKVFVPVESIIPW